MQTARKRRRWPLFALAAVALLAAAALLVLWEARGPEPLGPLSAEEQAFVGTWVYTPDVPPPGLPRAVPQEWEFRPDRTWRTITRNAKTGAVMTEGTPNPFWRAAGGTFTLGMRAEVPPLWGLFGGGERNCVQVFTVTEDGPGRYRWRLTYHDVPGLILTGGPNPTGTWTRVPPKE